MWMTLLTGHHISTDVAVVGGEPRWWRHVTGKPGKEGTFDYWTVQAEADPDIEARCGAWVRRHLLGYTGMLNLETLSGSIIEAHLRFADQWPDLYGAGLVEALIRLYQNGEWEFADKDRRDGFSVVLFGPHGPRYRHPPEYLVEELKRMPSVSSVQITFHQDLPPEPHAGRPAASGLRSSIAGSSKRGGPRANASTRISQFKRSFWYGYGIDCVRQ